MKRHATPGHLFVLRGDLRNLACDAWLLPCDSTLFVEPYWFRGLEVDRADLPTAWPDGATDGVARAAGWPVDRPPPYFTDVVSGPRGVARHLEATTRFVEHVLDHGEAHLPRRARPLLAVPMVGTGRAGSRRRAGEVANVLLPHLQDLAASHGVDIALVCYDADAYAAAQAARRAAEGTRWRGLHPTHIETASALAARARAGRLVLFLGAGVSMGAGLPDWKGLLAALSGRAALEDPDGELGRLAYLDQAEALRKALGDSERLGQAVREVVDEHPCHSLGHALLAALPVTEAVTTNYDRLFEQAWADAGADAAVLPYDPSGGRERWLLKMHGCVRRPSDIVLSRRHYLRYEERRAALTGIVQAMLITKHMLFVGFSLQDDNFHRIADAVRRALQPPEEEGRKGVFGTGLTLFRSPLFESLWEGEMRLCPMHPDETSGDAPAAARTVDIMLDRVAYLTAGTDHLMDPRFLPLLNEAEVDLRDALLRLARAREDAGGVSGWDRVDALLRAHGWRPRR